MSSKAADLVAHLISIEECTTTGAIWAILKSRVAQLGMSLVMVTKGHQVHPFTKEMVVYGELPAAVAARLEANGVAGGRLSKRVLLRSSEPFLVSRGARPRRTGNVASWYGVLRRLLSKDAIFIVPVHRKETVEWIAVFAGKAGDFDSFSRSILSVLVHAANARVRRLAASSVETDRNAHLSARERACLGWTAKGRTLSEIGRLLKIRPRTVRFHLDNARTKLGVVTRAQAVRKAIRQQIIRN